MFNLGVRGHKAGNDATARDWLQLDAEGGDEDAARLLSSLG